MPAEKKRRKKFGFLISILILIINISCAFATDQKQSKWVLTQYPCSSGNQSMCYSLVDTEKGDLILIDGGWPENQDRVRSIIQSHEDHVKAWFLTHYHLDHIGAFNSLYEEYKDKIDTIYTTPLPWDDFLKAAKSYDTPESFELFLKLTEGDSRVVQLKNGDEFDIGIFHVQIFNAYDDFTPIAKDIPNNCSLMIKFNADGHSILFCGDLHGKKMSQHLIDLYGEKLKADIVQAGHHGNNSLKDFFYEYVKPRIMLFDSPEWLMNDDSYTAKNLKDWCDNHAVLVYSYKSAPNSFSEKQLE